MAVAVVTLSHVVSPVGPVDCRLLWCDVAGSVTGPVGAASSNVGGESCVVLAGVTVSASVLTSRVVGLTRSYGCDPLDVRTSIVS